MSDQWSLLEFIKLGGPFMWPLIVFSVATVALIIERILYIVFHDLRVDRIRGPVIEMLSEGREAEAEAFLKELKPTNVSGRILTEMVTHAHLGEHLMEKAVEAEAQERIRRLENGFNFLTALASISPLTGFLGTVSGMIGAFKSIATATEVNAQLVANGIYEALITTVFGLIIAIIALIGYNLLAHRVDTFAADMTKTVSDIVSAMASRKKREAIS